MTTFYHYDSNGAVTASTPYPAAEMSTCGPLVADAYEQQGDVVGAFLARRGMAYPAPGAPETQHYYGPSYHPSIAAFKGGVDSESVNRSYQSSDGDEKSGYTGSPPHGASNTPGWAGWASFSAMPRPYSNPEDVRHLHTLQSLLPYLQPERKLNALNGLVVDIVEQDTGVVLAYQVPKKMLVLFLGRRVVNRFIRTIHREDDENWRGAPVCQEMNLPRGVSSQAAMKALIAWMFRACQYQTMGSMKQIRIPKNTFVACSLAQTMELFELHKDALRVDHYIAENHFVRPIFAVELETLWNCLSKESRYVYAAIKVVGQRICESQTDSPGRETLSNNADMLAMLKEYPGLEARVRDPKLNEQYRPSFNTKWIKRMSDKENDRRKQKSREPRDSPSKSPLERSKNDQSIKNLGEVQQEADLETPARKFAVLRIVPETAKPAISDTWKDAEPDQYAR